MTKPKRHRFIVEIIDKADFSVKQMKTNLHASINLGLRKLGYLKHIANLQVKEASRVESARRKSDKWSFK